MYKNIGLFLLFVLSLSLIPIVGADSDCSYDNLNYHHAEKLYRIRDDGFNVEEVKCDFYYRINNPNYFRAEDLFALGADSPALAHGETIPDYVLNNPNYFRAEDLFVIGDDSPILVQDNVEPVIANSKNALPQLDDELVGNSFMLPVSEAEPTSASADTLRQSAQEFFGDAEFELAIQQYEALLAFEPNNVQAHFSIGYAYYALEIPAQAVVYLEQALDLQPNHLYAKYLLAMSYSMLDMSDDARSLMSEIYGTGNYDSAYPLALGHVFRNLGYIEAAGAEFYTWLLQHETIRLHIPSPIYDMPTTVTMNDGIVYETQFQAIVGNAVSISVESHILNQSQIDPLIVVLNSSGIAVAGDDDSGDYFDAMLTFDPPATDRYTLLISHAGGKTHGDLTLTMSGTAWTADMYRVQALEYLSQQHYQLAIDMIGYAIGLDGGRYNDYMMRGYAYRQLDDPVNALAEYALALEISPYPQEVYANIGQVYRTIGELDSATIAYIQALDIDPLLHAVRCELGIIYASQGAYKDALLQFDYVLTYNITDSCAWSNREAVLQIMRELETPTVSIDSDLVTLARQYKAEGKLFSAATVFVEALALDPTLDDARCELGILYLNWGNYLGAIDEFDTILSHNRTHECARTQRQTAIEKGYAPHFMVTPQDFVYLGNLYSSQYNWRLAASAYATALDLDPTLSGVRCKLGMIYTTLEDYQRALDQFDEVLTQNMSDYCALENRRATIRLMNDSPSSVAYSGEAIEAMEAYSDNFLVRDVYEYPLPSTSIPFDDEVTALYKRSIMMGSHAVVLEAQRRYDVGEVEMASGILNHLIDVLYAPTCSRYLVPIAREYRRLGYTAMANSLEYRALDETRC